MAATGIRRREIPQADLKADNDEPSSSLSSFVNRNVPKLDLYPKLSADFKVQSSSGAVIYVVMACCLLLLFGAETVQYLAPPATDVLEVDTTMDVRLKISLNITFFALSCAKVDLIAMDVAGEHQLHVDHDMHKMRIDSNGVPIGDKFTAAPKKHSNEATELPADYCGDCFGAAQTPDQCCNTCDELKSAYATKGWSTSSVEGQEQCIREAKDPSKAAMQGEGCVLAGTLTVNKVAGNFHVAVGTTKSVNGRLIHAFERSELSRYNASHRINYLSFGEGFEGQANPMSGQERILAGYQASAGVWQYYVKLIPFARSIGGAEPEYSNQYSYTEKFTPLGNRYAFNALPGVFVIYDYSPFLVHRKTSANSFLRYLTRLCGACGGVFAIGGLLDKIVIALGTLVRKNV